MDLEEKLAEEDEDDVSYEDDSAINSLLNETEVSISNSVTESDWDDSLVSVGEPEHIVTSTPNKKTKGKSQRANPNSNDGPFKKPAAPSYFQKCPKCKRGLKTEKGYNKHVRAQQWKELANKIPSDCDLLEYCHQQAFCILNRIKSAAKFGEKWCSEFLNIIENLAKNTNSDEWKKFFDFLCYKVLLDGLSLIFKNGIVMPSTAKCHLQKYLSVVISSAAFRDEAFSLLLEVGPVSQEIAALTIFDICRKLVDRGTVYIYKCATDSMTLNQSKVRSGDDFCHALTHQKVYYICWSALRCLLKSAYQFPKNPRMQRIKRCILSKFSKISGPTVVQDRDKAYWTSVLNRKSLFFVNDRIFPFFLEVCKILAGLERPDGSLDHSQVMDVLVTRQDLIALWDNVVDSYLDEDESFFFMVKTVRQVTRTFCKGILLRRMNNRYKKGKGSKATISVSHRARRL